MDEQTDRMDPQEVKVNQLYWESDESVNGIADRLGLSKGRLYDAIRPLPAGVACPACGAEMVFENRTAREREDLTCPACGATNQGEEELEAVREPGRPAHHAHAAEIPSKELLGGALVGLAVGILIGGLLRR